MDVERGEKSLQVEFYADSVMHVMEIHSVKIFLIMKKISREMPLRHTRLYLKECM